MDGARGLAGSRSSLSTPGRKLSRARSPCPSRQRPVSPNPQRGGGSNKQRPAGKGAAATAFAPGHGDCRAAEVSLSKAMPFTNVGATSMLLTWLHDAVVPFFEEASYAAPGAQHGL